MDDDGLGRGRADEACCGAEAERRRAADDGASERERCNPH
jgi:hypothetical protein